MTKLTNDLKAHLEKNHDRQILKEVALNRWFTGAEVEEDIQRFGQLLDAANFGRDDLVFMGLNNTAAFLPINQALWRRGVTAHPVSGATPIAELTADYQAHHYAGIVATKEQAEAFADYQELAQVPINLATNPDLVFLYRTDLEAGRPNTPTEDSYGWIMNTSGTTGKPKHVGLTHEMMRRAAQYDLESHKLTADDTVLVVMPMFHINAQELIINSTLLSDGRIVIAPKFSASRFWTWINENDATWSSVVPTIVTILLKNEKSRLAFDPNHHLRFVRCASAMLPLNRHKAFVEAFKVPILEGWGMTEACSQCTLNPLDAIKLGSVGKPYHTEVMVYKDGKYTDEVGVTGELVIRGDHVIHGYLDKNRNQDFYDGWFHTGDLGYFDEDGYLWLQGRIKHVINRGGEKVSPIIVENVLSQLDFVANVAVVPTPDDLYGEAVTAAIIPAESMVGSESFMRQKIDELAQKSLPKYRQPTKVFFVDAFPLNPTGKIMREKLSEQLVAIERGDLDEKESAIAVS